MFFLLFLLSLCLADVLIIRGMKPLYKAFTRRKRRLIRRIYLGTCLYMALILLLALLFRYRISSYPWLALYYYGFSVFVMLCVVKVLLTAFLVLRVLGNVLQGWLQRPPLPLSVVWVPALFLSLVVNVALLWGMLYGRFDYRVERLELSFEDLPEAFDGYQIVQISDTHLGSWWGIQGRLSPVMDIVQGLGPDLIVFTGDLVNNQGEEISPFMEMFRTLKAPDGQYAVPGNHDYGRYFRWKHPEDSLRNLQMIHDGYAACGFRLLRNEAVFLSRGGDSLMLIGTENGSRAPFPDIAYIPSAAMHDRHYKILLTHDPWFWREKAVPAGIPLTLSGHSHGFQVSLRLGQKILNPLARFYPYSSGLFRESHSLMYVNRGLGWIGFAGRLSVFPEITQIILRKKN